MPGAPAPVCETGFAVSKAEPRTLVERPLAEDVVETAAFAVHADGDVLVRQRPDERLAGELHALVMLKIPTGHNARAPPAAHRRKMFRPSCWTIVTTEPTGCPARLAARLSGALGGVRPIFADSTANATSAVE
jgi:hypothetical protein